jgi:hypothetical protein
MGALTARIRWRPSTSIAAERERGPRGGQSEEERVECVYVFFYRMLVGRVWFRSSGIEKLLTASTRSAVENDL